LSQLRPALPEFGAKASRSTAESDQSLGTTEYQIAANDGGSSRKEDSTENEHSEGNQSLGSNGTE
jgi:hypothetical protein